MRGSRSLLDLIQSYLHSPSNINMSPMNRWFTPILSLDAVYERFEE